MVMEGWKCWINQVINGQWFVHTNITGPVLVVLKQDLRVWIPVCLDHFEKGDLNLQHEESNIHVHVCTINRTDQEKVWVPFMSLARLHYWRSLCSLATCPLNQDRQIRSLLMLCGDLPPNICSAIRTEEWLFYLGQAAHSPEALY